MFIKQLRTGMRSGSCPGASLMPTCNPGERCTPSGLTWGRGMCVTITNQGNQCLDMCSTKIPLDTFHDTPGKKAGTLNIVEQVRGGRDPAGLTTCPGPSVWIWLWIPVVLCCLSGLLGLAYLMYMRMRAAKRGASKGKYREPEMAFIDEQQPPYGDYGEAGAQPPFEDQRELEQFAAQSPPQFAAQPPPQQTQPPPQQTQEQLELDPMPVIEQPDLDVPGFRGLEAAEQAAPIVEFPGLFDQPNLVQGWAPPTLATPNLFPGIGLAPLANSYSQAPVTYFPQAGSMVLGGGALGSRPAYGMTPQTPSYGAYGAYGTPTTVYPGTTSMRIG